MSVFGSDHKDANELWDVIESMLAHKGLHYVLYYLAACMCRLSNYYP